MIFQKEFKIKFKRTNEKAVLPKQNVDDVGFDLHVVEDGILLPQSSNLIDTGLTLADPIRIINLGEEENFFIKIEGRSGLSTKSIFTTGGIIDASYRGNIKIVLYNGGQNPFEYKAGDRLAQMIFYKALFNTPSQKVTIEETGTISETTRGDKGFGSSGGACI